MLALSHIVSAEINAGGATSAHLYGAGSSGYLSNLCKGAYEYVKVCCGVLVAPQVNV